MRLNDNHSSSRLFASRLEIMRRRPDREPVQRDDFFPGQLVGGTPAHPFNIGRLEAPGMSPSEEERTWRVLRALAAACSYIALLDQLHVALSTIGCGCRRRNVSARIDTSGWLGQPILTTGRCRWTLQLRAASNSPWGAKMATRIKSKAWWTLPAAFPLFATDLGALGLLGWRRKRKSSATAAG